LDIPQSNRVDEAIALLKIGVELHPKSSILYGSLGDLYARKWQKALAIQAYRKALEFDPTFEHAREMLKKLTIRSFTEGPYITFSLLRLTCSTRV
jgi:tetratricopeptide (TPR) repeat protein